VRIATFNVNSIKARLGFVRHWLVARAPDVACLQELKVTADKFPHEVFEELGYRAAVYGQARWNGVAVLAREPLEIVQEGLPGADEAGARLLTVRLRGIEVTSVYVPNGKTLAHDDFRLKLSFLDALEGYLRARVATGAEMVVGGDFNLCPRDLDSWAPERFAGHIFHTAEERRAMDRIFALGLIDLYRHKHPEGTMFSWWDYRAGCFHKNQGLRIDLLLGTRGVADRTREVMIDRDYRKKKDGEIASDHAPVMADLT
jgi:exodeoxyribonuclease III